MKEAKYKERGEFGEGWSVYRDCILTAPRTWGEADYDVYEVECQGETVPIAIIKRIVACVNACRGMDHPEDRIKEMRDMIDKAYQANLFEKQSDV